MLVGGDQSAAELALCGRPLGYPEAVLASYGQGGYYEQFLKHGRPVPARSVRVRVRWGGGGGLGFV